MRYIFAFYNDKPPVQINRDDIIRYLNFIKKQFGSGYDKCRMVAQACSFFYKNILRVSYVVPSAFYPRKEFKLPNILSEEEVMHLLECTPNFKHKCMLAMFYGTGMRLDEMCNLKMSSIDAANAQVKVEKGKGNKDRITIFPKKLLEDLRCYYKKERPKVYLFEGNTPGRGMSNGAVQVAVRNGTCRVS